MVISMVDFSTASFSFENTNVPINQVIIDIDIGATETLVQIQNRSGLGLQTSLQMKSGAHSSYIIVVKFTYRGIKKNIQF